MNSDARQPLTPIVNRALHDIKAFLEAFLSLEVGIVGGEATAELSAEFENELVERAAHAIAERMVSGVAVQSAKTWRAAARQSLHGKRIYQALRTEMASPVGIRVGELTAENTKLIAKLPDRVHRLAQAYIGREGRRGTRAATIAKELEQKLPQLKRSQAKMLARTEVGRAETALTRARAERLGMNWYEWATSEDQRVRLSHRAMASVLVSWTDPPSPEALAHEPGRFGRYHPGTIFNCRCLALPLIDLDEVRWPHRVYAHGRIEYVNRAQFERWISVPGAA